MLFLNPGNATIFRNCVFVVDLDVICAETVLNPMQMVEQYAQFCNENEMLWMLTTRYVTLISGGNISTIKFTRFSPNLLTTIAWSVALIYRHVLKDKRTGYLITIIGHSNDIVRLLKLKFKFDCVNRIQPESLRLSTSVVYLVTIVGCTLADKLVRLMDLPTL